MQTKTTIGTIIPIYQIVIAILYIAWSARSIYVIITDRENLFETNDGEYYNDYGFMEDTPVHPGSSTWVVVHFTAICLGIAYVLSLLLSLNITI